jgi:hypothetical protein
MRFHVDQCVRKMAGFEGRFSPEMETFWRDVETLYKNCNVMQIPQEHLPLWWARCVDQRVPLEAQPALPAAVMPEPIRRAVSPLPASLRPKYDPLAEVVSAG